MNTKDVLELLETARYTCDDHIHGYDYHIYCLLLEVIDEATDKIEKFEDGLKTTKKNLENWSRGASQQKYISIFNGEIVSIRKILESREE